MGGEETSRIDRLVEQFGALQGQLSAVQSSINALASQVVRLVTAHEALIARGCPGKCQEDIQRLANEMQTFEHRVSQVESGQAAKHDVQAMADRLRRLEEASGVGRRRRITILTGSAAAGGGMFYGVQTLFELIRSWLQTHGGAVVTQGGAVVK